MIRVSSLVLALALTLTAGAGHAAPFASTSALDTPSRQHLQTAIARAKTATPSAFTGVGSVIARADALDHRKRGRFYPMTPLLRVVARQGSGQRVAVMALLEPLVFPDRFALPRSPTALVALRAGLLEAAGDSRDPAAAPVYRAVLARGTEYFELRAAAEALGKLGIDADVAMLARMATTGGPRQDAVIAGLGSCRRAAAARALATVAASHPDVARARRVLASLGTMGSSWALAIPGAAPAAEVSAIRTTAAAAALRLYVDAPTDEVRADASNAVVTIDAPDTPALVLAARKDASPETRKALDALTDRLAHDPTRTR